MVFQAIGKYIPPTRYRQIIETESSETLDSEEQNLISEDQKHSSNVARVHYQKKRSRAVALKARVCMEKLRGAEGNTMDSQLEQRLRAIQTSRDDTKRDEDDDIGPSAKQTNSTVHTASGKKHAVRFTKE